MTTFETDPVQTFLVVDGRASRPVSKLWSFKSPGGMTDSDLYLLGVLFKDFL